MSECEKCGIEVHRLWAYQPKLCMKCYHDEFYAQRIDRPIAVEDLYRTLAELVQEFMELNGENNPTWRYAKLKLVQYAPNDRTE